MSVLDVFCHVDAVWKACAPQWPQVQRAGGLRQRATQLSESEIMTVLLFLPVLRYRDFKTYSTRHGQLY